MPTTHGRQWGAGDRISYAERLAVHDRRAAQYGHGECIVMRYGGGAYCFDHEQSFGKWPAELAAGLS